MLKYVRPCCMLGKERHLGWVCFHATFAYYHCCTASFSFVWLKMDESKGDGKRWRKKKGKKRWALQIVIESHH